MWGSNKLTIAFASIAAIVAAAPAPAAAAEAEPSEIIVTGERVKRSLFDTPSSVSVTTQSEIEAQAANRVGDLLAMIPNVQLGTGSQGPTIRGQDTTGALQALPAFLGGNRPRTTLIVDGRRTGYNEFVFGAAPVWDLNRIEVFRSPQTTTQGQNSIAGAIIVYSNDPTFKPEYRARAMAGNLGMRQASAMASGALVGDEIAFRAAGDIRYSRTASDIKDVMVGADPNHDVFGQFRFKLLAVPSWLPGSRFTLSYAHVQSQRPQIEGVVAPFKKRRDLQPSYGIFRTNVDSLTARTDIQAGRDLSVNATATAGDGGFRRLARQGLGQARIAARDWSVEAVADWSPEGPFRLTAGLSHTHQALRQVIDLSLLSGIGRFRDSQDGSGLFGEASLAILSAATVTAGIRYQTDRQKRQGALENGTLPIDLDYDRAFHAWLPKLSFAYDFTPNLRAGLLVERAYNPGGTTLRFDTGLPDNFEAETLRDYEFFARARLAGGAVTAEANLFYYDMRHAQRARDIQILTPTGFKVGFSDLFNIPKARSYGLEASLRWRRGERFSASASLGLLGTKILRAVGEQAQYDGKEFGRSTHLSASASVDWRPIQRLRVSAQLRHHSRYFSDDLNRPSLRVKQFTDVDARAEYDAGPVTLFGYARNLFDTFHMNYFSDERSGTADGPREIGLGVETRL